MCTIGVREKGAFLLSMGGLKGSENCTGGRILQIAKYIAPYFVVCLQ